MNSKTQKPTAAKSLFSTFRSAAVGALLGCLTLGMPLAASAADTILDTKDTPGSVNQITSWGSEIQVWLSKGTNACTEKDSTSYPTRFIVPAEQLQESAHKDMLLAAFLSGREVSVRFKCNGVKAEIVAVRVY